MEEQKRKAEEMRARMEAERQAIKMRLAQEDEEKENDNKEADDAHKKMLQAKVDRAIHLKKKWKAFCWYIYFPQMFFKDHIKKMLDRRVAETKAIEDAWGAQTEKYTKICLNDKAMACYKEYAKDPSNFIISYDEVICKNYEVKFPSQSDLKKRVKDVYAKISVIMSSLIGFTKAGAAPANGVTITSEDFDSFSNTIIDRQWLPNNHYFLLEINRLEFDTWGRHKNLKQDKLRMIIVFFFIVKVLIVKVLFKPWAHGVCEEKKPVKLAFKCLCSVMIHSLNDWIFKRVKLMPSNMDHLEKKYKSDPITSHKMDDTLKLKRWVPRKPGEEPPIFQDIIEKEFLTEFSKMYDENLFSLYDQFAEAYYAKITGDEEDD